MLEVLDFYADWCGPCQMMKPIFAELEKEYHGRVTFTVINVDESPERSTQYNVLGIPTYIIMKDGAEAGRIVGFTPKPAFTAKLDLHLAKTA
jgi:thioredoxin 1